MVDKSLSGIKNELFPLERASRPQHINHFQLACARTGLVSVSRVWFSDLLSNSHCQGLLTKAKLTLSAVSTWQLALPGCLLL